jgi:hypothetical protein
MGRKDAASRVPRREGRKFFWELNFIERICLKIHWQMT